MENPNADKVAVVDEIKARLEEADAVLLTEYRGLNVAAISELRRSLRAAGGDYKVYKNTLVGFAAEGAGIDLGDMLTGPTALAFVTTHPDGTPGDAVTVAKALRDFARGNPNLVVKGGLLGDALLSADEAKALADVAPREELLARLAGGLAAPMVQFAGLLQALPRNFAYGLAALIEDKGGAPEASADSETQADTETAEAPEAEAADTETAEAPEAEAADTETAEAPEAEAADTETAEAPEAEAADTDTAEVPEAANEPADEADETPEEN